MKTTVNITRVVNLIAQAQRLEEEVKNTLDRARAWKEEAQSICPHPAHRTETVQNEDDYGKLLAPTYFHYCAICSKLIGESNGH